MRLSRILPAIVVFVITAFGIGYKVGLFDRFFKPIIVAVIDTGVDIRIQAIASRLTSDAPGLNLVENNSDVTDEKGHGTKVALIAVQNCGGCRLLPIKISKGGYGARAQELVTAIRYALDKGAKVINVSFGLSGGSPELEAIVKEAADKGAVIVTAAGGGIVNPFRPEALEQIYPQSYQDVIVVGVAQSLEDPDLLMNSGDLLDIVITGQPPESFGSSLAAATISGTIAQKLSGFRRYNVQSIRALLRATSKAPSLAADLTLISSLSRLGFGAFDSVSFLETTERAAKTHVNVFRMPDDSRVDIELSSVENIESVKTEVECKEKTNQPPENRIKSFALKKGRARVVIERSSQSPSPSPSPSPSDETSLKDCQAKMTLLHPDGKSEIIKVEI